MHPVSGVVVFIIIWWCVIFCVLPLGLSKTYEEPEEGEDYRAPGSPQHLNMKKKFLLTTVISVVLWVLVYLFIEAEFIDFRALAIKE